ncbi:CHAD domain-containing protein [Crenobacter intestini]|uniref:CHAD domain-containing protein n=1 Tax=Crenobacter intestini TaxID=2563443 RepID=A0A4T0UY73_9NEIS|nr:CHAD domain-containing protein [Crenobacter intestini]
MKLRGGTPGVPPLCLWEGAVHLQVEALCKRWAAARLALADPAHPAHPDAVHEVLRIVRVLLAAVPSRHARVLRAELGRAYRDSTTARELEVMLALASRLLGGQGEALALRYAPALAALRVALATRLAALAAAGGAFALLSAERVSGRRVRQHAKQLWRAVLAMRRRARRKGGEARWHALRIALKRCRFYGELFAAVLPAKAADRTRRCRRLQGLLGQWRDLAALDAFLAKEGGALAGARVKVGALAAEAFADARRAAARLR